MRSCPFSSPVRVSQLSVILDTCPAPGSATCADLVGQVANLTLAPAGAERYARAVGFTRDVMAKHHPGGGRNRNAYCSFCRKSYRDVGPLVEGPGDVYICGECIELCQSIIDQEKRRRGVSKTPFTHIPSPRSIKDRLDQYVIGQSRAKKVLSVAVHN